ncbi:MAG: GNAT family N-acetyltransferase [Candidatus Aquicultor sp.]
MQELTVERLSQFDTRLLDELSRVEAEAFGEGGLNHWTFPVFIRHGAVFVLKCGDALCGVADVLKDWKDPELAFVVGFAIREDRRSMGFGTQFLHELLRVLRDEGIKKIQLTVDPECKQAISVYRKAGFEQVAELADEYGPGIDRLLYELNLSKMQVSE